MGLLVCAAFAFHNLNLLCLEARACLCGHKAIIYVYSLFSFVTIRLFQGVRPCSDRNCLIINGFAAASTEHQIYIFYVDICVGIDNGPAGPREMAVTLSSLESPPPPAAAPAKSPPRQQPSARKPQRTTNSARVESTATRSTPGTS